MKRLACLNFKSDMSWGYIEGYRRAADLLAQEMLDGNDVDYLIYPMGYLYRHHVELQLKFLIERSGELVDEPNLPRKVHTLQQLWDKLRPKLKDLQSDSEEFLAETESGIKKLDSMDPSGQEFRYWKTTTDRPSLEDTFQIDIEQFHQTCEALASNLQAVHDCINAWLTMKEDFQP